jgi:putative DNA primase/helicase
MPTLPEALQSVWRELDAAPAAPARTVAAGDLITAGARNDTLYSKARKLHNAGLREAEIVDALRAINLRCQPPLGEAEVGSIAHSAATLKDRPGWTPSAPAAMLTRDVELVCAANIEPEAVTWLWPGWLAAGKLHIVAGPPGTGKTTVATKLAAILTSGGHWPDGSPATEADVFIWSGEDGIADTLLPRLIANGADRSRVHFVRDTITDGGRRAFDPATDTPALARALSQHPEPKLLIVDPIVSAVAGDSHNNAETRRSLQPLVDLAEQVGCAILGVSHYSKGTAGRDPVERVTGSIAFGAVARLVFAAVKTTNEDGTPGPRLLARAKSNLGPGGGGFHYDIEQAELEGMPGVRASRVVWGGSVEGEAQALLAAAETAPEADPDVRSQTEEAVDFLRHQLAAGPVAAGVAMREARKVGLTDKVVRRACDRLGIQRRKSGMRGGWEWALPGNRPKMPWRAEDVEDAPSSEADIFVPTRARSPKVPRSFQDALSINRAPSTSSGGKGAFGEADVEASAVIAELEADQ